MTIYEFKQLDEMEQIVVIWEAIEIGKRENREHTITLYSIDNFYVEYWGLKGTNVCRKIQSFNKTRRLAMYGKKITMDDILGGY